MYHCFSTPALHDSHQTDTESLVVWLNTFSQVLNPKRNRMQVVNTATGTSTSTCGVQCSYCSPICIWEKQGWHAAEFQQTGFVSAARQYDQEAHDRTEVAFAEAAAQTQADTLHEHSGLSK